MILLHDFVGSFVVGLHRCPIEAVFRVNLDLLRVGHLLGVGRRRDLRGGQSRLIACMFPGLMTLVFLLFSEVGRDMSRWPTAGHFVSWFRIVPGQRHQRWQSVIENSS